VCSLVVLRFAFLFSDHFRWLLAVLLLLLVLPEIWLAIYVKPPLFAKIVREAEGRRPAAVYILSTIFNSGEYAPFPAADFIGGGGRETTGHLGRATFPSPRRSPPLLSFPPGFSLIAFFRSELVCRLPGVSSVLHLPTGEFSTIRVQAIFSKLSLNLPSVLVSKRGTIFRPTLMKWACVLALARVPIPARQRYRHAARDGYQVAEIKAVNCNQRDKVADPIAATSFRRPHILGCAMSAPT